MYRVDYTDKHGASCSYYPRTWAEMHARFDSLVKRHVPATFYAGGRVVGRIVPTLEMGARRYTWYSWIETDEKE